MRDSPHTYSFRNDSGESMPGYSLGRLVSVIERMANNSPIYSLIKPDGAEGVYIVNQYGSTISPGIIGSGIHYSRATVVYSDESVMFDDVVGPTAGLWYATREGEGLRVLDDPFIPVYGNPRVPVISNAGSGGGGNTIWFVIDEVHCPDDGSYVAEKTLVVIAEWYTGGCGKIPPGANYDGTYNVYDLCAYLSYFVLDQLVGKRGRATYHYPLTGYCEPRWIIDDICHQPECS